MSTELPKHIIEKLIELGKSDKIDDPAISADFEQFRSYSKFGCYSMDWLIAYDNLSVDDHIALLKAVVMAMRYSGWAHGSVSVGIWIYGSLMQKVSFKIADDIALWVIEHCEDIYMPFGSSRDRTLFIRNRHAIAAGNTCMIALKLDEAAASANRAKAQEEIQKQQHVAKILRLKQKEKNAAEHYLRKAENFKIWQQMIARAKHLDEIARLCLILEYPHMPLLCFPGEWAEITNETLQKIDDDLWKLLSSRIKDKVSTPWCELYQNYQKIESERRTARCSRP